MRVVGFRVLIDQPSAPDILKREGEVDGEGEGAALRIIATYIRVNTTEIHTRGRTE